MYGRRPCAYHQQPPASCEAPPHRPTRHGRRAHSSAEATLTMLSTAPYGYSVLLSALDGTYDTRILHRPRASVEWQPHQQQRAHADTPRCAGTHLAITTCLMKNARSGTAKNSTTASLQARGGDVSTCANCPRNTATSGRTTQRSTPQQQPRAPTRYHGCGIPKSMGLHVSTPTHRHTAASGGSPATAAATSENVTTQGARSTRGAINRMIEADEQDTRHRRRTAATRPAATRAVVPSTTRPVGHGLAPPPLW
jgi:hypothetical protein